MIETVVVGYGLAGRVFHCPLISRQRDLHLRGVVARDPALRSEATATWGGVGYPGIDAVLDDPDVHLVVIATPHDTHEELVVRTLEAGKHCVVDKVMALSTAEADRMIAARDRSGKMLSVFHNRRWDWDFATLRHVIEQGLIGPPVYLESSVCRHAPPRTWRGDASRAGTILHDWGAHQVDQALQLGFGPCRRVSAQLIPAPWPGVDSGGHGRILLEFDDVQFHVETSRIAHLNRPRWWVLGTEAGFLKYGVDPQEDALRAGRLEQASEPPEHLAHLQREGRMEPISTCRSSWDTYYANIADHLLRQTPLAVTAEQAREVVYLLELALESARTHQVIEIK